MRFHHLLLLAAGPLAIEACQAPATNSTSAAIREAVDKKNVTSPGAAKYVFTEKSTIGFTGSMPGMSHNGGFSKFTGHFHIADGKPVGNDHKVVIDMNSIWADNEGLTWHLKSPDFFDVANHPQSKFDVTSVEHTGGRSWNISGNFTLHGVTRNITFPATIAEEGGLVRIDATFDVKRRDFGITYATGPADLLADEVVIRLNLEATAAG